MKDPTARPRARPQRAADRGGRDSRAGRSARRALRARRADAARVPRPRHRHRHGQVGHHLPQDRRDALEHRHARRSSCTRPRPSTATSACCSRTTSSLALSYSGETEELLRLLETIKRLGARLDRHDRRRRRSTLAQAADVALDCRVSEEACPLNLVPTASTTASLALGDALAMTLLVAKGFRQEDFANLHPGGKLGKRLMRVEQLMHAGEHAPVVRTDAQMPDVIYEISSKGLGMACVVDERRRAERHHHRRRPAPPHGRAPRTCSSARAGEIMTAQPDHRRRPTRMAAEALHILEQRTHHRGRRRGRGAAACSASCTCTTSGGSRCSRVRRASRPDDSVRVPRRARRPARRASVWARPGSATSCATAAGSTAAGCAKRRTTCSA